MARSRQIRRATVPVARLQKALAVALLAAVATGLVGASRASSSVKAAAAALVKLEAMATTRLTDPSLNIPSTMKCIVYGTERFIWGSSKGRTGSSSGVARVPSTGRRGHVLVKVVAAGLNPVDAKNVIGDKLPESWTTVHGWIRRYILSHKIPGFDFAGVCMEDISLELPNRTTSGLRLGQKLSVGDNVFGIMPPFGGTLAEYISVPLHQICCMPNNLSFVEAAALPLVGLTALQALSPHVTSSSSVLIVGGSGGTGHVALPVARCLGALSVTTICSTRNVDFCRSLGATHVVDYTRANAGATTLLYDELRRLPSQPFDVVMDCVTSADPRDQTMDYPALLQKRQQPASPSDDEGALLTSLVRPESYVYRRLGGRTADWIRAGLERVVCKSPWWWPNPHDCLFWIRMHQTAAELQQLREWVEAGQLRPHVTATYDFTPDCVADAMEAILARRVQGKVVVCVSKSEDSSHDDDRPNDISGDGNEKKND